MAYEFMGVEAEIPFAPAAGAINGPNVDSIIDHTQQILRSPLTFARWASGTYHGGEGNEPKYGRVYYHNRLTGQVVNSLGLPSVSIDVMEEVFPDLQKEAENRGKVLIPGVSAAGGDDPLEVLPEMAERLVEAGAQRIEINYSCPNKITDEGGREPILSHDLDMMFAVDEKIIERVGIDTWILRKIAPLVGGRNKLIVPTARYFASAAGHKALSFNTVGGQSVLTEDGELALGVPNNVGGMSGPATRQIGRNMLSQFRELLPNDVQIDSPLGVRDGGEVYERVDVLGANITSGVSIYFDNEEDGISYEQTSKRIADQYYEAKELALASGNS